MIPQMLLTEIERRYGVVPEYLWRDAPDYAVFRHAENRKWFAVLLNPPGVRLGLAGVLPAYHMNKSHWLSLHLAALPDAVILDLLDDSFQLTRKKFKPRILHDDPA